MLCREIAAASIRVPLIVKPFDIFFNRRGSNLHFDKRKCRIACSNRMQTAYRYF